MKKKMKNDQKLSIIMFVDGFEPDRIYGKKVAIEKLGMKIKSKPSKESTMWDYENPSIEIPKKKYRVGLDWNEEKDCCDVMFENGVMFGYVSDTDFTIC